MVVTVLGAEHADADIQFQVQITGDTCSPAVADACGNKELALVTVRIPLKVVLTTATIQTEKMPGKGFALRTVLPPTCLLYTSPSPRDRG